MNNSGEILSKKIEEQEKKDRFIASKCLEQIFWKGKELKITPTEIQESVDLNCSIINLKDRLVKFNVEIKERNKSEWQLEHYPQAELKVEKYNKMREATNEGTRLLYMVLLNAQTCLVFDLDNLDWSKVKKDDWEIKKTQLDPYSGYVKVPTFFIPLELAVVNMDCSEYFDEWTTTQMDNSTNWCSTIA